MANLKQGTQRKFSWKFLLLTSMLGLATLILFFLALENLLPPSVSQVLGMVSFSSTLGAANKIVNENLLTLLTSFLNALFQKIRAAVGLAGDPPPPEAREPILEGPYDFAILYKAHANGERAHNLIRDALREKYFRRSSSEPAAIYSVPWTEPDEFESRWQNAISEERAMHCIVVFSDDSFCSEYGDDIDFGKIRARICERITKRENLAHSNESLATLIFLNRAWEIDFYQKVGLPGNTLISTTITIEQHTAARNTITAIVPARHCDTRLRMEDPTGAAGSPGPDITRVFNAPRGRNLFFIDRKDSEAGLLELFQDIQLGKHVQILTGPVGSGKTQIALAFAHRYYQGDDGERVGNYSIILWLDARNSLEGGIQRLDADLTSRLGLNRFPFVQLADIFQWLKEQRVGKHWLLIIDRCKGRDFNTISPHLDRLDEKGHVLLTLDGTSANIPENASLKRIGYMEKDMAANLLARKALGRPDISIEHPASIRGLRDDVQDEEQRTKYWDEVRELVRVLGYHPLLISYAGALMKDTGERPGQYQEMYQRRFEAYIQHGRNRKRGNREDFSNNREICRALSVWKISYSKIKDPVALEILRLCTFLSTERIPDEIISKRPGAHQETQEKALEELERRAILRRESYPGPFPRLYRLEKLVREIIHLDLYDVVARIDKLESQLKALLAVSAAFAEAIPQAPERYEYYRPHIGESVGYLEDNEMLEHLKNKISEPSIRKRIFQFLYTVGRYYLEHPEKESQYRTDERGRRGAKDVALSTEHLFDLAVQLYNGWNPQNAPALGLETITLAEYLYGIALFYHEEFLYRDKHKLQQALDCYRKAAELVQDLVAPPSLFLDIHLNLGRLYSYRQEYAMAEDHFNRLACPSTATPPITQLQNAEIACSKATNQVFQAYHLQSQNTTAARRLYIDTYKHYASILASLQTRSEPARRDEDSARRAHITCRVCRTARLVILMQRSFLIEEVEENNTLEKEIEACRTLIEESLHDSRKQMKALDYLQLISDLSTLAEAYCELAQQKWKGNGYLEKARHYSLEALGLFDEFGSAYPKKRRQGQHILQRVWEVYQQNTLFDEEETRTKTLREQQQELLLESTSGIKIKQ